MELWTKMTRKYLIQKASGGIQGYAIKQQSLRENYRKIGKTKGRNYYVRRYYRHLASTTISFKTPKEKTQGSPRGLDVKAWRTDNKKMSQARYERLAEIVAEKVAAHQYESKTTKQKIFTFPTGQTSLSGKNVFRARRPNTYTYGKEFNQEITASENDAFRKNKWQIAYTGEGNYIIEEGEEK